MKKYSHSNTTKVIVFFIMIAFFTGVIASLVNIVTVPYSSVLQKSYFQSGAYMEESLQSIDDLTSLMTEYKNEEHILDGGSIDKYEWKEVEDELFSEYLYLNRSNEDDFQSEKQQYETFKKEYAEEISSTREQLIQDELREYHKILQRLKNVEEPLFYATDGAKEFSNTKLEGSDDFEALPSYFIYEDYNLEAYPRETNKSQYIHWLTERTDQLNPENTVIYFGYTEEFLAPRLAQWEANSEIAAENLFKLTLFMPGFIFSFIYLALVIGRRSFKDKEIHFHFVDKLYNDLNVIFCFSLISLFVVLLDFLLEINHQSIIPMIILIAVIGFVLILSLVKHFKNHTLIKHTLFYQVIYRLAQFIANVYRSGNIGIKTVLIVIGYPVLIAATFFMFPVTIGIAAWFAYKKVKEFQTIQDGVAAVKAGNIHHRIHVEGKGEFARLAENVNTITDGLKNAVDNELKSERLKTELITNVSHDIRTPLTSIITYVDLLKQEEDPGKAKDYVEVLDQKAKRLKGLTDDLFDAAKASSGDIPVQLEKIDVLSLLTQGLGEVADKIEENNLTFKMNHPEDKVYVTADGRLLWRSIENLLSNIFKYTLKGSRVYIDIEDVGEEIQIEFKNISATELNIKADELMERFKRGDESRTTEGSGLGLSIARSLIELQGGIFSLHIDGDLFKAVIRLKTYHIE
ncbi:HAMP domain-containing histidine kinase [Oceanobacillus luteolus]|uniref:histidine kinase n=1 Tax=Oceanobacillus luteolus TaxID=1274358 RepID=A0ABW4HWU1_9BACI|nr:HAMP domain-containing sensor histidine kinase [Oceanobacillus luteolus]MCM3741762.1 HAMP domain-containing histidine kinase [Oceanobacillus luteolus]